MLRQAQRFESLYIWKDLEKNLDWYFPVSVNRMPAKYLICRRIPTALHLSTASEEDL